MGIVDVWYMFAFLANIDVCMHIPEDKIMSPHERVYSVQQTYNTDYVSLLCQLILDRGSQFFFHFQTPWSHCVHTCLFMCVCVLCVPCDGMLHSCPYIIVLRCVHFKKVCCTLTNCRCTSFELCTNSSIPSRLKV